MSASLAWIDFSSAERARSQRILSALREPDSVDELGLGTIRDALSDALFPGTSTIQTRLAYFLMVPWIFRRLERERLDETRVADRARDRELALIPALKENRDHDGTIGLRSESRIKRLPSMVYWGGLRTWEIFRASLSREQYLAELPDLRRRRRRLEAERPDDQGVDPEHLETWHDHLPEAPDDFPTAASFALRPIDAEFLLGRIQSAPRCRGSMLAWLAGRGDGAEGETPWLHPRLAEMPAAIRDLVELARAFSDLTQGARLLYNVLLWEGRPDGDRDERLEELHATFAD
ncbi:MAG: hypothetical protein H6807_04980 [Planctomycetes bacterium]|nr:hypothetical protein [Planctomycetota bacterium]